MQKKVYYISQHDLDYAFQTKNLSYLQTILSDANQSYQNGFKLALVDAFMDLPQNVLTVFDDSQFLEKLSEEVKALENDE